jgi:hypothetical protein
MLLVLLMSFRFVCTAAMEEVLQSLPSLYAGKRRSLASCRKCCIFGREWLGAGV